MKNIPNTIFLQIGEDVDDVTDFNTLILECITWSTERIFANDIEYHINMDEEQGFTKAGSKIVSISIDR